MNTALSPDARADLVIAAMTQDEKLLLVNGYFGAALPGLPMPPGVAAADLPTVSGYIPGIARLGIPAITESDAGIGIANQLHLRKGDQATALPSGFSPPRRGIPISPLLPAPCWGEEARDRGYDVVLGGAMNLAREPRSGRTFEYAGEDPLLAGTIVGEEIRGIQAQGVITTRQALRLNDQETARTSLSANIDWAAARESDLLAFEIALEHGHPGASCAPTTRSTGSMAARTRYILTKALKQDWSYAGWVMSDWGATHSTVAAANAGLDQESAWIADGTDFFGPPLKRRWQTARWRRPGSTTWCIAICAACLPPAWSIIR